MGVIEREENSKGEVSRKGESATYYRALSYEDARRFFHLKDRRGGVRIKNMERDSTAKKVC